MATKKKTEPQNREVSKQGPAGKGAATRSAGSAKTKTSSSRVALAALVVKRLREKNPNPRYELEWKTPFQLLAATILAAQCTDERVNKVTRTLFVTYPDPRAFVDAETAKLEEAIRSTGTYRQKAKSIKDTATALLKNFGGEVPKTMKELLTLRGVARKTANVVLTNAFAVAEGVIVDTHVARVSLRMGLSESEKGEDIEQDLMAIVPKEDWILFGNGLVLHGRYTCKAKSPDCAGCMFKSECPKHGVE